MWLAPLTDGTVDYLEVHLCNVQDYYPTQGWNQMMGISHMRMKSYESICHITDHL